MLKLHATPFAAGRARGRIEHSKSKAGPDVLLVATQSELTDFNAPCAGLIVINGAPFSHIMARILGQAIPTVMIDAEQAQALHRGMELVLDGGSGWLYSADLLEEMPPEAVFPPLDRAGTLTTRDGQAIELRASVGSPAAAQRAVALGASAIGLLRSEYLGFDSRTPPSADLLERELAACVQAAASLPTTIRLPDIAADKLPRWCQGMPGLENPLGPRGVRLYDREPLRSTVQALAQAAGRVAQRREMRLLLPFLTHPEEYRHHRNAIEALLPAPLAIGAMIETPAAALMIDEFLGSADFVALGCNDLMQGLFAADRDIAELGGLLNPYAPAIFRLLRHVARDAGERVAQIQVNGLLSALPGVLPVLLGLGYRIFCVDPLLIAPLAHTIRQTDIDQAERLAEIVSLAEDAAEVRQVLAL
ncbi:MAG: putative PEP-binding protein [Pseudomonadota bacterium]